MKYSLDILYEKKTCNVNANLALQYFLCEQTQICIFYLKISDSAYSVTIKFPI